MAYNPPTMSAESADIAPGHIRLILVPPKFYLDMPLNVINLLCLKPRKYLRFLGWCILGVDGVVAESHSSSEHIEPDGDLNEGESYHYVHARTDLSQAIDLEVIMQRTNVTSERTSSWTNFRGNLLTRDVRCVFTGTPEEVGSGMHIIPYSRGSEWLQLIIANRPKHHEQVEDLVEINDIRNGVFATNHIHTMFDSRKVVILKTPNPVLTMNDIPCAEPRREVPEDIAYPSSDRYTLQWLTEAGPEMLRAVAKNNTDAAFKTGTREPTPSDLLLHYNYGAAAVKRWGRGWEVLQHCLPRPPIPMPAPMEPEKVRRDRSIAINTREAAQGADQNGGGSAAVRGNRKEMLDAKEEHTGRDEDDIMLFFWGNTPAAAERHRKKQDESTQKMEQWRRGVPSFAV